MKKFSLKNLNKVLSSDKARTVLVITGLIAIALIFLSNWNSDSDSKGIAKEDLSSSSYASALSADLISMIESIEGAGETQVLLTLESSYEYVYLDDDKTLSKILEPKVRGVAVACSGGDDPVVKEKIINMLRTVLSLSADGISVSKLI